MILSPKPIAAESNPDGAEPGQFFRVSGTTCAAHVVADASPASLRREESPSPEKPNHQTPHPCPENRHAAPFLEPSEKYAPTRHFIGGNHILHSPR